jgi:hypothetical protein
MVFFSVYFMSVPESQEYEALASSEHGEHISRRDSSLMHRAAPWRGSHSTASKPGKSSRACSYRSRSSNAGADEESDIPSAIGSTLDTAKRADEDSSLLSDDDIPGDIVASEESLKHSIHYHSHHKEVTGLALLPTVEFWLLFSLLGILTGIGLMTINNIGHGVCSYAVIHCFIN